MALYFALEHPRVLKALVLTNPIPANGSPPPKEETVAVQKARGNREATADLIREAFARPLNDDYFMELVDGIIAASDGAYFQTRDSVAQLRLGSRLSQIRVPTLIMWGDKDMAVPLEAVLTIYRQIPESGLQIWHGVAHCPHIEVTEQYVSLLTTFIQEAQFQEGRG